MNDIELLLSDRKENGKRKYIVFDRSDNTVKGTISIGDYEIKSIERCFKITLADGTVRYVEIDEDGIYMIPSDTKSIDSIK